MQSYCVRRGTGRRLPLSSIGGFAPIYLIGLFPYYIRKYQGAFRTERWRKILSAGGIRLEVPGGKDSRRELKQPLEQRQQRIRVLLLKDRGVTEVGPIR